MKEKRVFKVIDLMRLLRKGFDVCDEDWDWGTYLDYVEDDELDSYYDKFINLLINNIEIIEYNNHYYSPCKISEYIVKNINVFRTFFNKENREGYRPKDYENANDYTKDEGFYEGYLCGFESLLIGNYSEEDYEYLFNKLNKKKIKQN